MAFLLGNEGDAALDATVGELLPPRVFEHDFTWRFVAAWRVGVVNGAGDAMAAFAAGLDAQGRRWFDAVLSALGRSDASTLAPAAILRDFVRALWRAHLARRRAEVPATGGVAADMLRLRLTLDAKRLEQAPWNDVLALVREYLAAEGGAGGQEGEAEDDGQGE